MRRNVDAVGFISTLISTLVAERNVAPARVYATGISNGGIMVYRLACELSDKVAAIAPVAAALMFDSCRPKRPVSVMMFHGSEDKAVPSEGGRNWPSQSRR